MRPTVARLIREQLRALDIRYPELPENERSELAGQRKTLADELSPEEETE